MEFIGSEFNYSVELAIDKLDKRIEILENNINILLEGCGNILKTVDLILKNELFKMENK